MRLIDADAMRNAIRDFFKGCLEDYGHTIDTVDTSALVSGLVDMVESAYPVDAEPVRHGEWIEKEKYVFGILYDCSLCENRILDNGHSWNYCPNCGARMDGEIER